MYPPRPRSSLEIKRDAIKKRNRQQLTLAGFCVFFACLCAFLLAALVYVGRQIAEEKSAAIAGLNLTDQEGNFAYAIPVGREDELKLSTKPILRFRYSSPEAELYTSSSTAALSTPHRTIKPTLSPVVMATSKILPLLGFRLPKELRPLKYVLRLEPDLENKTFLGNVDIKVQVLQPISFIPVHSKSLTVETQMVQRLNESDVPLNGVVPKLSFECPEFEYWVTEFEQPLEVGNYSLQLSFNGSLANRIVGFYQSSYLDKQRNTKRWIATSKFEPTFARQAFPCFDEPAMKAHFEITIVRPSGDGYHALSNMNIESEEELGSNKVAVHFAQTVPMSTYLACFIVSDFASQSKIVRGVLEDVPDFEMRVFSTKAQVPKVEYALNIGVGITEYYIEYFNISYPLPKLDMAAIPDFSSGAMEHWGLVTYRETALLYDPAISSSANKQRVAVVVAHELAHMWFGNLVTMKWWKDLWLNEGFASYIEYKGVDKVHPDWDMMSQFLIADLHGVMELDATRASHPIVQKVESPSEITELFDSITYSKGASIIRMLENLVGSGIFRQATTNYLEKFYYQNAETNDFLNELEALVENFDIKLIMQTWTEQMGLPVVQVTKNANTYTLSQKRFFSNPEDYNVNDDDSSFNYRWSIPITYYTSSTPSVQSLIFNYIDAETTLTVPSAVTWIKFNRDQVGYYRVNYPVDMWQALITALNENRGVFSNADRAHLISDVFALADASQLDYSVALDLSTYLSKELDYVPWKVGTSCLSAVKNLLYYTDLYRDYAVYARSLYDAAYAEIGWNVEADHLRNLLRVTILSAACGLGNEACQQEAASRFNTWLANPSVRPDPDIRSIVYYHGMQQAGNEKVWEQVLQLFVAEQDAQEKVKLMEALAAVQVPWILQRYINLAWDENYVRGQDYFTCLQYISQNRIGQSLVWDHVRENWPKLIDRFGINDRYLGRLIPGITARFASAIKLEEMETFFAKYPEAGAGTAARKEALETVKYNIKWLQQNKQEVGTWLKAHQENQNSGTTTVDPNRIN